MLLSSRITGPVALGAIFDVENLFAAVVQIKHEVKEDMKAAHTTTNGDPAQCHLYVALFMELGNESNHREPE